MMLSSAAALCKFGFLTATSLHNTSSSSSSSSALRCHRAWIHSASLTSGSRNSLPVLSSGFKRGAVLILKKKKNKGSSVVPGQQDQSETSKKDDAAASNPPFLTILAGLVVFSAICWVIGSIVVWIIAFIFHSTPLPK